MLGRLKASWADQRSRRPWLDHVLRAWTQNGNTNASLLAGALTFFSFLALFPLVLLAVSVAGYILKSHPDELNNLITKIEAQAPGGFGTQLKEAVNTAIKNRTSIGVVGLAGVLLTGLGWIQNLRQATEQVWEHPPLKRNFVMAKLADAFVLAALGLGLIVSVALTAVGSELTDTVLKLLGLEHANGAAFVAKISTIAVAVLADMLIFGFLLAGLPRADIPRGVAVRAALLTAVGFEILKIFGTWYIGHVAKSPTYGTLGSLIGVLVWLNLVYRFLLYCTAWTAVATPDPLRLVPAAEVRPGGDHRAPTVSGEPGADRVPDVPGTGLLVTVLTVIGARRRRSDAVS